MKGLYPLAKCLALICTFAGNKYEDGVTKIPKVIAPHSGPHPDFILCVAAKAVDVGLCVLAIVQLKNDK